MADLPDEKRPRLSSWIAVPQPTRTTQTRGPAQPPYTAASAPPGYPHPQSTFEPPALERREHAPPGPAHHVYPPNARTDFNPVSGPPHYHEQEFGRPNDGAGRVISPGTRPPQQLRPLTIPMTNGHDPHHVQQSPMPLSGGSAAMYPPHDGLSSAHNGISLGPHGMPNPHPHDPMAAPSLAHGGYVQSPITAGPRDASYMAVNAQPASSGANHANRRKAVRAAQACDICRARKAKCDEGRPTCSYCSENHYECHYRDVPPPKSDRTMLQILSRLEGMSDKIDEMHENTVPDAKGRRKKSDEGEEEIGDLEMAERPFDLSPTQPTATEDGVQRPVRPQMREPTRLPVQLNHGDDSVIKQEETEGRMGELAIPLEHTTAAHKLLRWPSIKKLVASLTNDENYVMREEENRGILRLYGRGEGRDLGDSDPPRVAADNGILDDGDGFPYAPCPFSHGVWGIGFAIPGSTQKRRIPYESAGGLNPDGSLKLESATLFELLTSYQEHIHVMHPFLERDRLDLFFRKFNARYNNVLSNAAAPLVQRTGGIVLSGRLQEPYLAGASNQGQKRKRVENIATPTNSRQTAPKPALEKSISTALVLLVLALGKVCQHTDWLPGPLRTSTKSNQGFSPATNSTESPGSIKQSPPAPMNAATYGAMSSPQASMHRRPSVDAQASRENRSASLMNVDVIPGLAYYAIACEILGSVIGANDLPHVQAFLLAGLYAGQLGRVFESWKWINIACTACLVLIRPSSFDKETNADRKDLIICAFWTCLQLESDILAELDLPPSGISRHEDSMTLPKGTAWNSDDPDAQKESTHMWMYYYAQIALRKLLNRVHTALYTPQGPKHPGWSIAHLTELEHQLNLWRENLPRPLQWEDTEDPPSDINAARLRAKYHGARYIIHRPFLHHAIHPVLYGKEKGDHETNGINSRSKSRYGSPTGPVAANGRHGSIVPSGPADIRQLDKSVVEACKNCIISAVKSTSAFDGIAGRPIVTNIFGTAHAQFGNLLVLQAAYSSSVMTTLVHGGELHGLIDTTIKRLRHLAPISPALSTDAMILERSMQLLVRKDEDQASTSFSSNLSGTSWS